MTRALAAAVPAALCALLAVLLFTRDGTAEQVAPPPPAAVPEALTAGLVQRRDMERLPAGSPERAFVTWWHDIQYLDAQAGHAALDPSLQREVDAEAFAETIQLASGGFVGYKPQVVARTVEGDRAELTVNVIGFQDGRPSAVVPRAFTMRRVAGHWRIGDLAYVELKAREGRAAAQAASRAAPAGS